MGNRIGPRTALDIDASNQSEGPVTARAKFDADEIQAADPKGALHLVNVQLPTGISSLQEKFEGGTLGRIAPEDAATLFEGCPGQEKASEADRTEASQAFNRFLNFHKAGSNIGRIRAAVTDGSGESISPIHIGLDALTKVSQTAGTIVGGALAGANVASSLVGAVRGAAHAVERSDVLSVKKDFLKQLEPALQNYLPPNDIHKNGQLALEIGDPENSMLGVHEMLSEAFQLADRKEQKRIARASMNSLGNTIGAVGGAMTIAGAAGAGIGAVPGLIVGAVGAGVNLSTSVW